MTDREMLELAAKAAGKQIDIESFGEYQDAHNGCVVADGEHWNPFTDDGDALRLAVKLCLITETGGCWISKHGPRFGEDVFPCPYAATRRAIVRAAAEIGKQMP